MEIFLGAKVSSQDGRDVGTIDRVVLDPDKQEITHIVVGKGLIFGQDWLVPLNMVQEANEHRVLLYENADQLHGVPQEVAPGVPFIVWDRGIAGEVSARPPAEHAAAKAQERALSPRQVFVALTGETPIMAIDGPVGKLAALKTGLYEYTVTNIVIAGFGGKRGRVDLPVQLAAHITPDVIKLAATVEQLRHYVPPEAGMYLSVEGEGEGAA